MTRSAILRALLCTMVPTICAAPAYAQSAKAENFVALEEFRVPIVDASRIEGVLRVSVTLQMPSAIAAEQVARKVPELRAAGLAAVIEFARLHASPFTPIDVAKLSAALTPAFHRVDKGIQRVLVVKVSAHTG